MSLTVEEMIAKVEMYVFQRQLGIAEILAAEFADDHSQTPLKQSGYAILSIAMAYFEMIEQFSSGEDSKGKGWEFFLRGFMRVYPGTPFSDDQIKEQIYRWVRCGMYHGGTTRNSAHLSRWQSEGFDINNGEICINPARVVQELKMHFRCFVQLVRDPCNCHERPNFEKYCRLIGMDQNPTPSFVGSTQKQVATTPRPGEPG